MISTEFIDEHSNYAVNPAYTPEVMREFDLLCRAAKVYYAKRGYNLHFTNHFFDQMKLVRGNRDLYTTEDLMQTLVTILQRGMQFFKGKVPGTNFVFLDQRTRIYIAVVRDDVDNYVATTTVRDYKWKGDGQVIRL
jgi:membrane protease subunit (stomatin/prohibitin family)